MKKLLIALALAGGCVAGAQAGEAYAGVGLPGVMVGYAHTISPTISVRGDFATHGSRNERRTEEGVTYDTKIGFNRVGLFADWFVAGGFRLVGGLTFNQLTAKLSAKGDGVTQFTIGGATFTSDPDDRMDVKVTYPKTTPYLGIGYGHHGQEAGWGFLADIGASIGKARVSETHSGPSFDNGLVTQADVDQETEEIRDGVGKVRFIPQVSIGVSYRF